MSTEARILYQKHCEESISNAETAFYSADLQKVIMLPWMPAYKTVQFTRRIIVFNESFIPLQSTKGLNRPFAVLWNENVAGRKKENLVSAFHKFFLFCRDKKHIVVWLDNCTAQNKNWCFYTFLIYLINSSETEIETIDVYYFKSGHTFMSADTFHHQVEESMKKAKNIYDFSDFVNAVRESNSRVVVHSMIPSDFSEWRDYASQQKLRNMNSRPLINEIKHVRAIRGNMFLKYSTDYTTEFNSDENLKTIDFLQIKIMKAKTVPRPLGQEFYREIPKSKKTDIINKLLPLMPKSRHEFWKNLNESEAPDLTVEFEE